MAQTMFSGSAYPGAIASLLVVFAFKSGRAAKACLPVKKFPFVTRTFVVPVVQFVTTFSAAGGHTRNGALAAWQNKFGRAESLRPLLSVLADAVHIPQFHPVAAP